MSTYGQFEAILLVACHLIGEERGKEIVPVKDAIERYGLDPKPNWIMRALESYLDNGLAKDLRTLGSEMDQDVWLTAAGVKQAEHWLDSGAVRFEEVDDEPESEQVSVDSSAWTGLPAGFVLSDDRRTAIVSALDAAEGSLPASEASQHDQAQARAYIVAARALLEAPEPDTELAWQLVNRANSLAGIASLFVAIIALFMAH